MFTGEYEKLNLFNEKSDVRISAHSISLKNEGKTKAVFNQIKFIGTRCGVYKGSWDFDGIKRLKSLGVTEQKDQLNIFEYKGKLFYIKPALDKADTSKWSTDITILNAEYVNNCRTY